MQNLSVVIKPCCDTEEVKPKHGKANCKIDKRSQHQGSSCFEKETQLQPMQFLNSLGRQPEKAQAGS